MPTGDALPYRNRLPLRHPGDDRAARRRRRVMETYSIGDGVRTTDGPMKHQYGTVVFFREDDGTYLVRFGGSQQLYFRADELEPWA